MAKAMTDTAVDPDTDKPLDTGTAPAGPVADEAFAARLVEQARTEAWR